MAQGIRNPSKKAEAGSRSFGGQQRFDSHNDRIGGMYLIGSSQAITDSSG